MAKVQFTKEQQEVIDFTGNNLLVSAAAGSGKTTVMIERVAKLIATSNVSIKDFLIISFTKASASDMKNKLISKLMNDEPTPFILEQIEDIATSDVSNLHSFCARFLKLYFYEVGLDPTFVVLDQTEVDALKQKALSKLFSDKAEKMDMDFFALVDIFSKSRQDTGLKNAILKLYDFMQSVVDAKAFIKSKIESLYDTNLDNNSGANLINSHLKAERVRLEKKLSEAIAICSKAEQVKLASYLQELDTRVKNISLKDGFLSNAKRLGELERMPNFPKAEEDFIELYDSMKDLKEEILNRIKNLKEYALVGELEDIPINLTVTKKRIESLLELCDEFETIFKALKKEKGGLDFNDLESYTLLALENQTILSEVKSKYKYVLVDEYQDINGVQEEIIRRLSSENNRFMVGDVKQSIYRFRLCDPEIFLDKYALYDKNQGGKLIRLNANFRSKKAILDFVNAIFDRSMTEDFGGVDYKNQARLISGSDSQVDDVPRVKLLFSNSQKQEKLPSEQKIYSVKEDDIKQSVLEINGHAEGLMIASEIANLVAHAKIKDSGTGRLRKVKFSDITILTSSRTPFLNEITKVLAKKGIPVSTDIEGDCLEDEYVYGLKSFLEALSCYKDDYSLFSCLYSKVFAFTTEELAQIKIATKDQDFFYKSISKAVNSDSLDIKTKAKLKEFMSLYEELRQKASFLQAKDIVNKVIESKDILAKISFEEDSEKRMQKLKTFINSLSDLSIYDYLSDTALASVKCQPAFASGSVKVMTIHKSKGLEFGVVFLVGTNRGFNFKTIYNELSISKDLGVSIDYYNTLERYKTATLARSATKLIETRKLLEEQQRLLYVALTRATDYLFVVGSGDYEKIKTEVPTSPTCFMDFMGMFFKRTNIDNLNYNVDVTDANALVDCDQDDEPRQVIFTQKDEQKVDTFKQILNKTYKYHESVNVPLKTAVTALASENIEGQSIFVYDKEASASNARKGTIYHLIMQNINLLENSENAVIKQLDNMLENGILTKEDISEVDIVQIAKILSNEQFNSLIKNAKQILREKEFYTLVPASFYNKDAFKEDQIVVQGIVDLCLIYDDGLVIIDYKTGNLKNAETLSKYNKQLELYAEAMQKSFGLPVKAKYIASLYSGELI